MSLLNNCIESGEHTRILRYISSVNHDGEDVYFIVAVKPAFYSEFLKLHNIEHGEIMKYGEIISSGRGKMPDQNALRRLKEIHDTTYDFIEEDTVLKHMDEKQIKRFFMEFCAMGI